MLLRFAFLLALLSALSARAQSVWQASTNKNWHASGNWSASGVPNSGSAIAEFGATSQSAVNINDTFTVDRIRFTASAPAYTFSLKSGSTLIFAGTGIVNNATTTQTFAVKATGDSDARLAFINSAHAGNAVITAQGTLGNLGIPGPVAKVDFLDTSSAGTARLTVQDAGSVTFDGTATAADAKITIRDTGSYVTFRGTSTAANATFTLSGGRSRLSFMDSSDAGQASIKVNSGGTLVFWNNSSAGSAQILANSVLAPIAFIDSATAGSATIDTLRLDFSANATAANATFTLRGSANFNDFSTAGSATLNVLAGQQINFNHTSSLGSANVVLGGDSAVVFNNTSTGGSGVISGTGRLVKNGAGTVVLSGANTYSGSTTVSGGKLLVDGSLRNTSEIIVGSGATLGGSGLIAGATTVLAGGRLAPGSSPGTLTFTDGLALSYKSIIDFELGAVSDLILLTGGTLAGPSGNSGIKLNLSDSGGFTEGTYILFDFSSGGVVLEDFDLTDFTFGKTIAGFEYGLGFEGNTLRLTATASAIPEPSTYAALCGLIALGLSAWRKRRSR